VSGRRGKTEPRIWTPPLRELTPDTTLGYDVAEFATDVLHLPPLPWQRWLLIHALEIVGEFGVEWHLRFRVVLVLVARQNGKTYISMILALFFLYVLGVALILGTAQDLAQAEETWEAAVNEAERNEELAEEIQKVFRGKGSKELRLEGYRRYKVATPNEKNTRGKSCELVMLDELRTHKTFDAWSAASKTTKARRSAIVWCISNAGDGSSVVLRHLRIQAHRAIGDPDGFVAAADGTGPSEMSDDEREALGSIGIFEWSAKPGCDKWDRDAWAQANPSMGYGFLDESAIASDCASDPENDFRVEDLCQWITQAAKPPFPEGAWEAGTDEGSRIAPDSPLSFGVDVSADRRNASIAVCGERADHRMHVELIAYERNLGWVVDWFRDRVNKYGGHMSVALQGGNTPVASLADLLGVIEGVDVEVVRGPKAAEWCGRMWDAVAALDPNAVKEDGLSVPVMHVPQPRLDLAANVAVTRPSRNGTWTWDRDKSPEDVSPIVAATMALGLATEPREEEQESAYAEADLLIL
jgi:phage terminase large subunit-like protein